MRVCVFIHILRFMLHIPVQRIKKQKRHVLYLQYCFVDSLALVKMYFNFAEQLHVPAS